MKIKRFLLPLVLIAILPLADGELYAQNGFNIPFSQFGIGMSDMPYNVPSVYGMGGTVYSRPTRSGVNPFNPASYAAVEKETFVFDIGLNLQTCVLRSGENSLSDFDGNLAYIMVAFPITRWWKTSAGLLPYSTVDYNSVYTETDPLGLGEVKTTYWGDGGVSQLYWGNAFNIGSRLSVGFNINYLYGNIDRRIIYSFPNSLTDSVYAVNLRKQKNTLVSNFTFDLGLQYTQPLGKDYNLRLGVTCKTPRDMTLNDQALMYTYAALGNEAYLLDTIFPQAGVSDTYKSKLHQPLAIGVGLALEKTQRWEIDVDGYYSPYSGMKYEENPDYNIFGVSALRYTENYRIALGGEWKGNPDASTYFGRIGITGGLFYNRGRLAVEVATGSYTLNEIGGGIGFRLPVRKGRSNITLALGYSSFGDASLLRRDTFSIGISVGSCETWFMKRKYN